MPAQDLLSLQGMSPAKVMPAAKYVPFGSIQENLQDLMKRKRQRETWKPQQRSRKYTEDFFDLA